MKKIISLLFMVLLLTACGSKKPNNQGEQKCSVLNVYNWGVYIGENVNANFEKKFGVKVNYSLFDSNEAMYTKLLSGSKYDVLVPSDYTIERLINEKQLAKLDKNKLPNINVIYDGALNKEFDQNNDYSIPYFWGNVGIVYDARVVDQKDVETQGWEVLKNTKYAGKIYMYDSERDSFMVAFKSLGYSMNTENEEEIQKAYEWLSELHTTMKPAYVTDEAIDGLTHGEKAMGVMYSGDAAAIIKENANMRYFVPNQGTNYWTDSMVIPKTSECQELAHEYINFVLDYDSAYDNSITVGYSSPNKDVLKAIYENEYQGINAYLPSAMKAKDEVFKFNDTLREKLSELWIKVKNK